MTASIRALKFNYSEIHKFKLSSAENQRRRKLALDNAQKAKTKHRGKQTRTFDLLKGLCIKNQEMMLEVFRVNEIGERTILRPLRADEAHTDVFALGHITILCCSSTRMDAFQLTSAPNRMNCLNKWQAQSKLSVAYVEPPPPPPPH